MKNIKDFGSDDFLGLWKSSDGKITFYFDKKVNLVFPDKQIIGDLKVSYITSCESCINCLKIEINSIIFFVKQITDDGFFLTTDHGEILMKKII